MSPQLTLEASRFIFKSPLLSTRLELDRDSDWDKSRAPEMYVTTSLRAAAGFRRHADEKAKAFFAKTFQSLYDLPAPWRPELINGNYLSFLDPHQRAGVEWILTRKRSYLAHAPGAGKTAQAIVAALLGWEETLGRPVLVICPPGLTKNWTREIERFTDLTDEMLGRELRWPQIGVVAQSDSQDRVAWRGDFLIVPYSMLSKPWVYAKLLEIRPSFIICDEASALKEPTADRSLAFYGGRFKGKEYPGLYHKARHVVFLDGSPMPNRPMELWAPLYALVPESIDCMGQRDFGFKFCGGKMNHRGEYEFKYSSNEAELKERIRRDFMHVVGEEELSHPERRRSMLFMNQDVRTPEIKEWERKHLSQVLKEVGTGKDPSKAMGQLAQVRASLGSRKVPWIAAYVRDRLLQKNEQILLFAWHRDVCQQLASLLREFEPGLVMGGTSETVREEAFAKFQAGKSRLIIGNIAAMGRGHNLQKADRVIFGEYSWSDEQNRQCEKRASRRGSTKSHVRCEYIVVPDSMDEQVLASLFTKQSRVRKIIG